MVLELLGTIHREWPPSSSQVDPVTLGKSLGGAAFRNGAGLLFNIVIEQTERVPALSSLSQGLASFTTGHHHC